MKKEYIPYIWFLTIVLIIIVLFPRNNLIQSDKVKKLDVWKEASKEYTGKCGKDCVFVGSTGSSHGGAGIPLVYDPKIDDAIAQWGDCIRVTMECIKENKDFNKCMTDKTCPKECVDEFNRQISTISDFKEQRAIFKKIFIDDEGICVPED